MHMLRRQRNDQQADLMKRKTNPSASSAALPHRFAAFKKFLLCSGGTICEADFLNC